MRLAGIESAHRRRRGQSRRQASSTATASDLVQRQFTTTTAANRRWSPTSYLRTGEGFRNLAVLVDAYSRRYVRWGDGRAFAHPAGQEAVPAVRGAPVVGVRAPPSSARSTRRSTLPVGLRGRLSRNRYPTGTL